MQDITGLWPQLGFAAVLVLGGGWLIKRLFQIIEAKDKRIEVMSDAATAALLKNAAAMDDLTQAIKNAGKTPT